MSNPSGREIPGDYLISEMRILIVYGVRGRKKRLEKIVEYLRGPIYDNRKCKNEFEGI